MSSVASLSFRDEIIDITGTPEHDADDSISVLEDIGDVSGPHVPHYDTRGSEEDRSSGIIARSPSDSELSGAGGGGGGGSGLNAVGSGRRRGDITGVEIGRGAGGAGQ